MRRGFLILSGILLVALFVFLLLLFRTGDAGPTILLETHTELSGKADSDGDGVPNWLEEITDSDALNAGSFPYNRDVVRANKNTTDALLYAGPGDFTEEIIRRFLYDIDESASVTEEEQDRFVDESVRYFLNAVERKGLPDVTVSVDDAVSREMVLGRFVSAMRRFSDSKKPIDVLIFDVFSKNASAIEEARAVLDSCDYTLQTLPRKVPRDVYMSYRLVLERVTYVCEALTVSLTSATPENFFYALRLMGSSGLPEGVAVDSDDTTNHFDNAVDTIVQLLSGQ